MRQVAARAGVSTMTVSRALRDDPTVLPETRDAVLAAAHQLGYHRNELARRLRMGGTAGVIGLVVTNLANPFYAQLALGVETVTGSRDMNLVVSNSADDVERERTIVESLVTRRVDGIIVVPATTSHHHLAPAKLGGVPVVFAARPPQDVDVDCVLLDDYGGAYEATSRLVADGHRRIGFLGPPAAWTSAERLRGFYAALKDAGTRPDERLVRAEQRDVPAAEAAATELLRQEERPTALFCANSRNTIGAYRALRSLGLRCSLAGFDDFELADMLDQPVYIVAYDPVAMGHEAAELLFNRIAHRGVRDAGEPRRVVMSTTIKQHKPEAATYGHRRGNLRDD